MTNAELLARVEGLTTPDREVDAMLHRAFTPEWEVNYSLPLYTASIDATLALVERELPGRWWTVLDEAMKDVWSRARTSYGLPISELPLAILIALLRARAKSGDGR